MSFYTGGYIGYSLCSYALLIVVGVIHVGSLFYVVTKTIRERNEYLRLGKHF